MQLREIVFSDKRDKRLLRHVLFWTAWWLYFLLCDYLFKQPVEGSNAHWGYVVTGYYRLVKTFLLILLYAAACYVFIYLLMPNMSGRIWKKPIITLMLLFVLLLIASHLMYWDVFPFVDSLFGTQKSNVFITKYWPAVYLGLINPVKIMASAGIIKYVKHWWQKKVEAERLERKKINAELQLLKAQVHPDFLFTTLNNIYACSEASSPRTSGLLLNLSELLSYMLYECGSPVVPLEREIEMMKDYMKMEKIRLGESFEIGLTVRGDLKDKMIAPFLLFPFIEDSIKQSSKLNGRGWINMDISVEGHCLLMKLANGIGPGTARLPAIQTNSLASVQKRLNLIYPGHELKTYKEEDMLMVLLKIQLSHATVETWQDEELELEKLY